MGRKWRRGEHTLEGADTYQEHVDLNCRKVFVHVHSGAIVVTVWENNHHRKVTEQTLRKGDGGVHLMDNDCKRNVDVEIYLASGEKAQFYLHTEWTVIEHLGEGCIVS